MAAAHDERRTDLAKTLIGHADHGHLSDRGMFGQECLNLCRVRIESTDDEHVALAVDDGQIALRVEASDVTRVQPAGGVDRAEPSPRAPRDTPA